MTILVNRTRGREDLQIKRLQDLRITYVVFCERSDTAFTASISDTVLKLVFIRGELGVMFMYKMAIVFFITLCLGCGSSGEKTPGEGASFARRDVLGEALAAKGLDRQRARMNPATLSAIASSDYYVQKHFLPCWQDPYGFPEFCSDLLAKQEERAGGDPLYADRMFNQFQFAAAITGHVVREAGIPAFSPASKKFLSEAVAGFYKDAGAEFVVADAVAALDDTVPEGLRFVIARLIHCSGEAKKCRDAAFRNYPQEKLTHTFDYAVRARTFHKFLPPEYGDGKEINLELGGKVDYEQLYRGAAALLMAISSVRGFITAQKDMPEMYFEIDTPAGRVSFDSRKEKNAYKGGDYLLIIDIYGDDVYEGCAAGTSSLDRPVSMVMDFAGNDTYEAGLEAACTQGAGIMGYGMLFDMAGNDIYSAVDNAQGMCYAGVGMLYDLGGDDKFGARYAAQGSASFGTALLFKSNGNDSYYCYYTGQGFGYTCGCGILIDTGGDDRYVAEPYKLFNSSPENGHDAMRNYSFCQGAGWGQRDDTGRVSLAGGTGILQDLGGNDRYECGVYGQASGYWFGTGILHDKSGDDYYEGSFFVQSGTAHMGLTYLLDEAGNDDHHIWHAISLGGAHDLSISYFIDKAGDDKFTCWEWKDAEGKQTLEPTGTRNSGGGTLFGAGITNAMGVFINIGGDDEYEVYSKESFGYSLHREDDEKSWRWDLFNAGIFIDIGGRDKYFRQNAPEGWVEPGNNKSWEEIDAPGNKNFSFSIGVDTEEGYVPEAERPAMSR